MKFATVTLAALIALTSIAAARPAMADFEIGYFNDFQRSLDKFAPASTYKQCINEKTLALRFEKDPLPLNSTLPPKYNGYAELSNACGGPVWMEATLNGTAGKLDIQFDARNVEGCAGCIPLVYVGADAPKDLNQFTADYRGIGVKWERHTLQLKVAPSIVPTANLPNPTTVVAISFTSLDDHFSPLQQRIGIDNVSVTVANDITAPPPANN